jgi:hypothetical protein
VLQRFVQRRCVGARHSKLPLIEMSVTAHPAGAIFARLDVTRPRVDSMELVTGDEVKAAAERIAERLGSAADSAAGRDLVGIANGLAPGSLVHYRYGGFDALQCSGVRNLRWCCTCRLGRGVHQI